VTDDRPAVEQLLDLMLYGPIGLVLGGPTNNVAELARRGRERCESHVKNAKLVGEYAVRRGSRHLQLRIARLIDRDEPSDEPVTPPTTVRPSDEPVDPRAEQVITVRREDTEGQALPIPEYDSLAASQVVPRLAGLAPNELEAVRTYEAARRGRRTILAKIAQLQGA
jgi:hypothetical protein